MAEVVTMPKLGFDMAEGTLIRWVAAEGEQVKKGAVLAEIETDKATVEVESNYEGLVAKHLVKEGDVVPVSTPIAVIGADGEQVDVQKLLGEAVPAEPGSVTAAPGEPEPESAPSEAQAPQPAAPAGVDGQLPDGVRASPLARKIAAQRGLELRLIQGTGPDGRITKVDVETYRPTPQAAAPGAAAPGAAPVPASQPLRLLDREPRQDQHLPLSRLRAAIGRRMSESTQTVPHFFVSHEYDMSAVVDLRKQINDMLSDAERISVNDFVLKAVALTLREYPNLNASIDTKNNQIIQHGQINVGVAVAVENGLLTVVCKEADRKSIGQIAIEVRTLAGRAREGRVKPEDIEGSTFSVSNLGMFQVENFSAIINPPEAAILAVGSVREVPVVQDGEIKPGLRMKATISVDHRVSDGAEAARFMQSMAAYLEKPIRLLI